MSKDWIKHVHLMPGPSLSNGIAWCGKVLGAFEFSLIDPLHAQNCITNESWIQPCKRCMREIKKASMEGLDQCQDGPNYSLRVVADRAYFCGEPIAPGDYDVIDGKLRRLAGSEPD
jgi:hypothetical protein